jgi:hypothetical protein
MNRNRRFFHELTPFANALEKIQAVTPPIERADHKVEKMSAAQAKRERRMARNVATAEKDRAA